MAHRYPDYFRDLEHCLDRSKSREQNYESLLARDKRVRNQHGQPAILEKALLDQALKVFQNEASYQEYVRQSRSDAEERTSKKDFDEARRREIDAHRRARMAEEEKRREAERRRELERELEAERQRADAAEREAQETDRASNVWGDLLKAFVGAVAKPSQSPARQDSTYRPEPVNLAGDWRTPEGYLCRIWQQGAGVRIHAWDQWGRFIADSSGTFDGRFVRVNFQTVPIQVGWNLVPTYGVATYEVFNGGQILQGHIQNHVTGQILNVQLYRVG